MNDSEDSPLKLPYVNVQHDVTEVLSEIRSDAVAAEDVWVSAYQLDRPSVHGKIRFYAAEKEGEVEPEAREGIDAEFVDQHTLRVKAVSLEIDTLVQLPFRTLPQLIKNGIKCLDLSSTKDLFVVGGRNGVLKVGACSTGSIVRELRGHVGDILGCKFFPSGEVILSNGSDMTLRIFSALDGSNPRTFSHTRAVTGTCITGVGKKVASVSLDQTLRLWDVPSSSHEEQSFSSPLTACSDSAEEGGKVWVGDESGRVWQIPLNGVGGGEKIQLKSSSKHGIGGEVTSLSYSASSSLLASSHRGGLVRVWDVRRPDACLKEWRRNDADVNSVLWNPDGKLLYVAGEDGLPYTFDITENMVAREFAAWEDGVEKLKLGQEAVWAGGKDGKLRCYAL
ncbi:WD40 repeat-like protein [Atractiella rhizophila]|nr:WD40 repeat-like protein [Atractiella rhizophila]